MKQKFYCGAYLRLRTHGNYSYNHQYFERVTPKMVQHESEDLIMLPKPKRSDNEGFPVSIDTSGLGISFFSSAFVEKCISNLGNQHKGFIRRLVKELGSQNVIIEFGCVAYNTM